MGNKLDRDGLGPWSEYRKTVIHGARDAVRMDATIVGHSRLDRGEAG